MEVRYPGNAPPPEELPLIPKPRKSSVMGLDPNNPDGSPIIGPELLKSPLEGSLSALGTEESFSSFMVLPCSGFEEVCDASANPNPRSRAVPEAEAPIWAAFWSNAVADMAGRGTEEEALGGN